MAIFSPRRRPAPSPPIPGLRCLASGTGQRLWMSIICGSWSGRRSEDSQKSHRPRLIGRGFLLGSQCWTGTHDASGLEPQRAPCRVVPFPAHFGPTSLFTSLSSRLCGIPRGNSNSNCSYSGSFLRRVPHRLAWSRKAFPRDARAMTRHTRPKRPASRSRKSNMPGVMIARP
jgi:hypothetical protein